MRSIITIVLMLVTATAVSGERSSSLIYQFRKANVCPSTGERSKSCPGYVVDHGIPFCAGKYLGMNFDVLENLQYQERELAKAKDRLERQLCRKLRDQQNRESQIP